MQQRQPRLGDILDDYCPRERRLTNHVVVAMIDADVKQTRCSTCDTEHEYKHAKVPRQRRKADAPAALYAQVLAGGPKRVAHEVDGESDADGHEPAESTAIEDEPLTAASDQGAEPAGLAAAVAEEEHEDDQLTDLLVDLDDEDLERDEGGAGDGPVHRPLIRATLPRVEGQPPPTRPAPEFTIRQPGGRPNRFRQGQQRGPFQANRSGGNGNTGGSMRGGAPRQGGPGGGRPQQGQGASTSRFGRRNGPRRPK